MSNVKSSFLRRKVPQIIAAAIIVILAATIYLEFLTDLSMNAPSTRGPLLTAIMSFTDNIKGVVFNMGYPGIFGLMVLESSSLPVPSEVILPFAGFLISSGTSNLNFVFAVAVATAAAIVGSLIDYYIGLKGIEVLTRHRVLGKVLFSVDQLSFAGKWFNKYGAITVFLARLVPGIRTLISFPAGAAKMPLAKFLTFTIAGCILWNTFLIYVGYYLGVNWTQVASVSHYIIIGVVVALAVLIAGYVIVRRRKRRTQELHS